MWRDARYRTYQKRSSADIRFTFFVRLCDDGAHHKFQFAARIRMKIIAAYWLALLFWDKRRLDLFTPPN
jgi:hypothetical protein